MWSTLQTFMLPVCWLCGLQFRRFPCHCWLCGLQCRLLLLQFTGYAGRSTGVFFASSLHIEGVTVPAPAARRVWRSPWHTACSPAASRWWTSSSTRAGACCAICPKCTSCCSIVTRSPASVVRALACCFRLQTATAAVDVPNIIAFAGTYL